MNSKQFIATLVALLIGGVLGYYGNVVANRKNNELLVQLLKDQLLCLDKEIDTSSRTAENDALYARRDYLTNELQKRN